MYRCSMKDKDENFSFFDELIKMKFVKIDDEFYSLSVEGFLDFYFVFSKKDQIWRLKRENTNGMSVSSYTTLDENSLLDIRKSISHFAAEKN